MIDALIIEVEMAHSPSNSGIKNVRDFFARGDREKISPELKQALSLLQLSGLDSLEERFLATAAFLEPWAVFRDSIFLLRPDAMPRATTIAREDRGDGISRTDLLWFYTQFDEGIRRYDPRANKYSGEYTTDSSIYGAIDKSNWANTIDTPPFEGYAVTCGISFTFGGVRINTDGEVLNTDYQPIRGLYAAGELVGGLFYFNYPGGSGLTSGAVFGKIAGTSAARAGRN